jgi:hypothetical protein
MEPEEDEQDVAMESEADELETVAEDYGKFLPEVLDELERRCVREAFGIWSGYAAFCEECAGVGAEKLAAVVLAPVVGGIEEMKARAERLGLEPDAGTVEQVRDGLAESWRVVEERGV